MSPCVSPSLSSINHVILLSPPRFMWRWFCLYNPLTHPDTCKQISWQALENPKQPFSAGPRGRAWQMIIGRNERRGTWRLSHLQENAENDVQEFRWEQGCPLWGCFCCTSGWLVAVWNIVTQHWYASLKMSDLSESPPGHNKKKSH